MDLQELKGCFKEAALPHLWKLFKRKDVRKFRHLVVEKREFGGKRFYSLCGRVEFKGKGSGFCAVFETTDPESICFVGASHSTIEANRLINTFITGGIKFKKKVPSFRERRKAEALDRPFNSIALQGIRERLLTLNEQVAIASIQRTPMFHEFPVQDLIVEADVLKRRASKLVSEIPNGVKVKLEDGSEARLVSKNLLTLNLGDREAYFTEVCYH